jgi:hypothetical protein
MIAFAPYVDLNSKKRLADPLIVEGVLSSTFACLIRGCVTFEHLLDLERAIVPLSHCIHKLAPAEG